MEAQLITLEEEKEAQRHGKMAEYLLLDRSIGSKHLDDLKSMKKVSSGFERVKVNKHVNIKVINKGTDEVPAMNRCFRAFHYFSDLQTSVEDCFPGYDCLLKVSGTDDIVASQDELQFAYTDKAQEAPVLNLELRLSKSVVKKRKRIEEEKLPHQIMDNCSVTKRGGPWKNGEIELFKAGVKVIIIIKFRSMAGANGVKSRSILKHEILLK